MNELITLKHLKLYVPENPPVEKAYYLKSDEGADWYQAQIHFSPDSRKIVYTESGRIVFQHNEVHLLWPENLSISEVLEADLPAGFPASDEPCSQWLFLHGEVTPIPVDDVMLATRRRDSEMDVISLRITALVEAKDDGDITADEEEELAALRERRTKLRRLDLTKAPDMAWPE